MAVLNFKSNLTWAYIFEIEIICLAELFKNDLSLYFCIL
jgi:hypothetical protein